MSNPLVRLTDEVVRLQGRFKSIFAGSNGVTGLPSMELTVLTAVVEAASAPTVPQIGRSLGRPRQVIQRATNALIEAGLIEALPNPHHKRAPLLLPTRRGKAVKRKADARALKAANAFLRASMPLAAAGWLRTCANCAATSRRICERSRHDHRRKTQSR